MALQLVDGTARDGRVFAVKSTISEVIEVSQVRILQRKQTLHRGGKVHKVSEHFPFALRPTGVMVSYRATVQTDSCRSSHAVASNTPWLRLRPPASSLSSTQSHRASSNAVCAWTRWHNAQSSGSRAFRHCSPSPS